MSRKTGHKESLSVCLKRACFLLLGTTIYVTSLGAQSAGEYSISWIGQYPPGENGEKTSFGERMSALVFGQKPQEVIKPFGIVAASPQEFLVLDQGAGTVFECVDGKGEVLKSMRKADREFPSLVGICQIPGGDLLLTDSRMNQVFRISDGGLSRLSDSFSFSQPTGIAYSSRTGEVWVVETVAHRVVVLNRQGELIKTIGERGSEPGTFNFPTFIWIDQQGQVYIVDSMNFRVQAFDHQGNFLFSFGEIGDATGTMARPKGIATDSRGNIYVADALFHVVQIFDREGNYLYNFGGQGQEAGEFWMPAGICIDEQDFIYVADSYNARIQVFQLVKN